MRILSVCQKRPLWQNEKKICPGFYKKTRINDLSYRWKIIYPSFLRRRMDGGGGATSSTWNFGSTGPHWSEIADFQPIFACSASAITPREKSSINTNKKSTTCFPMSLTWSSYVASKPPKGGSKMQNGWFSSKIAHRLKKVCYKVSLCENCQRQTCKAFLSVQKWLVGGDAFYLKFWIQLIVLERNRRFSISFRS